MNLVGKIFIVLTLVMSLVFMSFAVAVYATHKNWYELVLNPRDKATPEKPVGLQFQLADVKKTNTDLTEEKARLEKTLSDEKNLHRQALAKLENENEQLKAQRDLDQKKLDDLTKQAREAVAAMEASQLSQQNLRKENEVLTGQIRTALQEREAKAKELGEKTDELHQSVNEVKSLKARNKTVVDDLANAKEVLRKFGLKDDPTAYSGVPPTGLRGVVLATPGAGLVEISIGADDGLMKGHKLHVYRIAEGVSMYLGQIEVIEVAPEKAVCKIILRKGNIQKDDRVAAELK